jgi:hypothetical protein
MADLTFNILEQSLVGEIDGTRINAQAVSGGRAGSKTAGAVNPLLANNPYLTSVKLTDSTAGGTLPLGAYLLKTHESRENWIRLEPAPGTSTGDRAGFAIHGRGKRGSDGCIVPMDFHNVLLIYDLCKAREDDGKTAPTLDVVAIGDADEPLQRIKQWQSMA